MTDTLAGGATPQNSQHTNDEARARLRKRYAAESRFKWLGAGAVLLSAFFLLLLLSTIVFKAFPAFHANQLTLPLNLSAENVDPDNLTGSNYDTIVNDALLSLFPQVEGRQERRQVRGLVSSGAPTLVRQALQNGSLQPGGTVDHAVPMDDFSDLYLKGLLAADSTETTVETLQNVAIDGAEATLSFSDDSLLQTARAAGAVEEDAGALRLTTGASSIIAYLGDGAVKLTAVEPGDTGVVARGSILSPVVAEAGGPVRLRVIATPEGQRKISDREIVWVDQLEADGRTASAWNTQFLFGGASREAEMAGIWGAVVGSALTMLVTLALSFPIGVSAAIYLEEFAPKNRLTGFIEVNINNLAAVPSIVFGLLGLAVFLNWFNLPRSAPLVGGMVLALMTLPTIIIASRAALRAVPPSIREAALGVGASKIQTVFHHVLPLAMPGILTGTIIGMAQALGETAPLLMIGMVAFIVDIPGGFTSPATVLPVQIFMWADFPEPAFQQKTSAAILILLGFLVLMNAVAVVLRKRFERRW
ncbi:phosphate ABC transporter permease PstA [Nitratireductor kimnyeongensis]|uniref:Phosphate transport system permease protein PstA n=1 Tax=Nitratireductor kimnyeongensis TaxID=430679 RepID=A0ABW0TBC0_9HYPH|nr:phosphate ABC transporter permease PstA [Nitratireductor kimnyeongensis]QZZ36729.1 phosphate ABC transporter permease PstA [Nitratireductor kimnyeongensis]